MSHIHAHRIRFSLLILFAVCLLSACNSITEAISHNEPSDSGERQTGVVNYVIDGDTFNVTLSDGKTDSVRVILVNTPETCHKTSQKDCKPDPYGEEAKAFARDLLTGETVSLELDRSERDPYGRLLAYVYLEDGRMYQELVLQEGLAEIMAVKPNIKHESRLEAIEQEAKDNGLNLWSAGF